MFNSVKPRSRPVLVLLLVLLAASGLGTASAHDTPGVAHPTQFTDVHSHSFYATAVDWMVQNVITTGTSPTTFHPDRNVTRGEAAAFLWRMSCRPEPAAPHSFDDVHAGWQQDPVGWLQQHGAAPVQGTDSEPADVFGPSTLLTRAQMAGLLYQLFGDGTQPETTPLPFVDVTEPWQTAPVAWLIANQVTTGTSPTTFHPDRNVTRGEFATFLWRHSQQPAPTDRLCEPPPTLDPANPVPDAGLGPFPPPPSRLLLSAGRQAMIDEDFGRVAEYLSEAQAGCRPWAGTVHNRCVLDAQNGSQLCFGWVTARDSLGWETCPRRIDHDGTGRPLETVVVDSSTPPHLRHDVIFGTAKEGLCVTADCAWADVNDPARQAAACARFWRQDPALHLLPGDGVFVCGPPDGCVRWYDVVADRCSLDGVLWCYYGSSLWHRCAHQPTAVQPSGVPCPSTESVDWVNRGRGLYTILGDRTANQIVLTPGVWEFTLCFRGNHHLYAHIPPAPGYHDGGPVGIEVWGPRRFDKPGPNGDTRFDGWAIIPHHTDPGYGDCSGPPDEKWWTYLFCVVSADDWDHHRVMVVTSTGQNPPFITHLVPSGRSQNGYWEITATKTS